MTGVRVGIEVDDAAVRAALTRLIGALDDPRPVMNEIAKKLEASTIDRFERERGPGGAPWRKSQRARREGGQTLSDDGDLRRSITPFASDVEAVVATNVAYAAIHQFGGRTPPRTIRPKRKRALFWPGARHPVRKVNHPGSVIPARPFLGVDDGDRAAILEVVRRRVAEAVR